MNFFDLRSKDVTQHVYVCSVIYQLSDIRTDDQILEGEIRSVIYQKHCFAPNILRDDYVIHFLVFRLERFDCSNIP